MLQRLTLALLLAVTALPAHALEIPLTDLAGWQSLTFRRIAPNTVSADANGLRIDVARSASPLVYRLDSPTAITGVTVQARWTGTLTLGKGDVQGEPGADDAVLKVGLVEAGTRTLNWLQKRIAADWILELYRLAPAGSGVERIHFLSTTQQAPLLGSGRVHPLNDLLFESRVTRLEGPGAFTIEQSFDEPVTVLGLWLSSDGDDTGSVFSVTIESLTLHTR